MSILWSIEIYRAVRCMCVVVRNFAGCIVVRYLRVGGGFFSWRGVWSPVAHDVRNMLWLLRTGRCYLL